jgi:tetratricopeptide (TPR) repeat protein
VPALLGLLHWVQVHELPESLASLHARFQIPLQSHPLLAASYALRVESLVGDNAAKAAWAKATEVRQFTPAELGYYPQEADLPAIYLAYRLEKEGGIDAARKEYHKLIRETPAGDYEALQARMLLAESLAEQGRFGDAASFMTETANAMWDNERRGRRSWGLSGPDPAEIQSRAEYFAALSCKDTDDEQYVQLLQKSINSDASNPDGLIELYGRKANTPQQQAGLRSLIRNALKIHEDRTKTDPEDDNAYNLWAWLASKTYGDPDQALAYSMQSLRLNPGSASYFDTMAACFAAKHDFVNAVRCQTWAVRKDPFAEKLKRRQANYRQQLNEAATDDASDGDGRQ